MSNMLDKSMYWDRMSKGVRWPKMKLTYSDGSVECTDGDTYQCEHGLRKNGKRPIRIELEENYDSEMLNCLYNNLHTIGIIVDVNNVKAKYM